MADKEQIKFEFEPKHTIKGYPELHWTGKRPYLSTYYYPAQLKERYGTEKDGWINKIFWGDNLQVMSHLLKDYRGKVDLIYIDPPFDSKADYKKKIELRGKTVYNDSTAFEEKQYGDIWTSDEYLQFMYERLILCRELLSDKGSLYLHCDYRRSSHLRLLADEVFGPGNFRNEIVWCYSGPQRAGNYFSRKHDTILFYSKSLSSTFHVQKVQHKSGLHGVGGFGFRESDDTNEILEQLESEGKTLEDWWADISTTGRLVKELQGYPTQKPEKLIERMINASSDPGDLVFDCFMGSGTTQAVAMKLGRRFLGADINFGAIQTTTKRLLEVAEGINSQRGKEDAYTGFEVYNVNNYDLFRNPVEAHDLLLRTFDVQPIDMGSVFDGELDGRMVKLMPINRIATKEDISAFVSLLPFAAFDKRRTEDPQAAVLKLTIICMGHEPDLKAAFIKELAGYKVDVEVIDILADRKDLEFKREAEAEIAVENGCVVIKNFYPLNLMQKLSMLKEEVEDWKQLVESVMIDFNYDGAVLEPSVIDFPEKGNCISGVYKIPEDAGTIRVKITDLLSESLEQEVK